MDEKELFSYNLTCLRKKKGKTQQDIAEEFNYTFQAVSRWETGKSLPDPITLKKIAEYYNVDLDFFFQEHDEFILSDDEKKKIEQKEVTEKTGLLLMSIVTIIGILYYILAAIPAMGISKLSLIATGIFGIALAFSYIFGNSKFRVVIYSLICWSIVSGIYFLLNKSIINPELIILYGFFVQIFIIIIHKGLKNK